MYYFQSISYHIYINIKTIPMLINLITSKYHKYHDKQVDKMFLARLQVFFSYFFVFCQHCKHTELADIQ